MNLPIKPMLCNTRTEAFDHPRWTWETKFDGVRAIVAIYGGQRKIFARSGVEKSAMFPDLQIQTATDAVLDGEIVAATGKFNDIQHRANRENGIAQAVRDYPALFVAFDILECKGQDITGFRLEVRRKVLGIVLRQNPTCLISTFTSEGVDYFQKAQDSGWEGVVAKDINSTYQIGKRSPSWIKVKVPRRDVFWVVGYTPGTGWRQNTFGALILGDLISPAPLLFKLVGEVGTGFDTAEIDRLYAKMSSSRVPTPPFKFMEPATWVKPFPVKIKTLEIANEGKVRFPSYKGTLPEDTTFVEEARKWLQEGK